MNELDEPPIKKLCTENTVCILNIQKFLKTHCKLLEPDKILPHHFHIECVGKFFCK